MGNSLLLVVDISHLSQTTHNNIAGSISAGFGSFFNASASLSSDTFRSATKDKMSIWAFTDTGSFPPELSETKKDDLLNHLPDLHKQCPPAVQHGQSPIRQSFRCYSSFDILNQRLSVDWVCRIELRQGRGFPTEFAAAR